MSSMTTQLTSLPPSAQSGRNEPGTAPRAGSGGGEIVAPQQLPGSKPSSQTEATQASTGELADAVARITDHMQVVRRNLQFDLDSSSGKMVVKIVDAQTKQVVRQIPSEEVLQLAKHLEQVQGLLFKAKA